MRKPLIFALACALALGSAFAAIASARGRDDKRPEKRHSPQAKHAESGTASPIKHLVVIFDENVSFDHYFATYPNALNPSGEPKFTAAPGTPSVNGLNTALLAPNNPNSTQPFRLGHDQFQTCDQGHGYKAEQSAFDMGLMDKFPDFVGKGSTTSSPCADYGKGKGLTMGYFDGNTVTALWNYAQAFSMSDNSYNTVFGPSTPGALNLISGQTHGATPASGVAQGSVIGDPDPTGDKCSSGSTTQLSGQNVGDLLNAQKITWGWFEGGFADCTKTHTSSGGQTSNDYIPHHEPFQYYTSTANPQHKPPISPSMIGKTDQANHQYDLTDFWTAVDNGNMPAVSYLKAPAWQDGHAGYSNPRDEQTFLVNTINRLQKSEDWKSTAVVIAYDDSDGWYDHQMSPIVNHSQDSANDTLTGTSCGGTNNTAGGFQDRCGYGPRLPLLVVSPFAKRNFVDHTITDQSSILRFVEENWKVGQINDPTSFDRKAGTLANLFDFSGEGSDRTLLLDPTTGQPTGDKGASEAGGAKKHTTHKKR